MSLSNSTKPIIDYDLTNVVQALKNDIFKNLSCMKVGIIESYDVATQSASIRIASKWSNPYSVEDELIDYPILEKVPVIDIGGTSYIHLPVKVGDECVVFFNDFMLDSWYRTSEVQPVQIPRRHDWSDGIALVGVRSLNKLIKNLTNFIHLHYSDSSYIVIGDTIEVVNDSVNITGSTTSGQLHAENGATGTFTNAAGQTLTIVDGIITNIG